MKLDRRKQTEFDRLAMRRALADLRGGLMATQAPCIETCPRTGERRCSPDCPETLRALSSEPATQPLEPAIAPLVYQIKKLGVFQPFWSCEGHYGPDGKPWKMPRVWFYSDSAVHVRVLAECLHELRGHGRLACAWQVALTYCEPENTGAAFALEPAPGESPTLAELQADARRIALALPAAMDDLLRRLGRAAAE